MRKAMVIVFILLATLVFTSRGYPHTNWSRYIECSNQATTLRGVIAVQVDQWYNASFNSVNKLVFDSAGTWDGDDELGETLGTFAIQSNGTINVDLAIDQSETTEIVYNMIDVFQLLHTNTNTLIHGNADKTISFVIPANIATNENIYDIRAIFDVANDTRATGNNDMTLVYTVTFQPTTRLH